MAIEAHEGSIVVDEAQGGGAMFRVRMPLNGTGAPREPGVPDVPVEARDAPGDVVSRVEHAVGTPAESQNEADEVPAGVDSK